MRVVLLLLLVLPLFARHYSRRNANLEVDYDYDDNWTDTENQEDFQNRTHNNLVHENRPPTVEPVQKKGSDREMELMDQQIKRNLYLRSELGININDADYDDAWMDMNVMQKEMEVDLTRRSASGGSCPESHPFVYYNGAYCCKTNKEKVNPSQGDKCDGSTIGLDSMCCQGNQYAACPDKPCKDFQEFVEGWCEHADKYLGGYSSGEYKYNELESAQSACLPRDDCGGITYETGSKLYTLRKGEDLKDSTSGEISWLRCHKGCRITAEVESLAEQITEAVTGKDLDQVKSYLNTKEGSLAIFQHDLLSRMAQAGNCIDLTDEVYQWIMSNKLALETFMTSGDIPDDKLAASMELFKNLTLADPDIKTTPLYLRLAVATAITHSTPVTYLAIPYKTIEPIQRYLDFKEWSEQGYLFDVFFEVSAWHLRYVVGSWQLKEELVWARENTPEGYATPEKIGSATHQVMEYKLENSDGISVHKGAPYYYYYPVTMERMDKIGGVCGAISKVGAGFCNAYGVPSVPVGQPGHCAYIVYQNDRWALHNDVSGWATTNTHGGIQYSWRSPSYFFMIMDLAQKDGEDAARYRLSEKMRLASYFAATKDRFMIIEDATTVNPYNFALWVEMKEAISKPDLDKCSVLKALLPTLEESTAKNLEVRDLAKEKKVTSECFGDTSLNMVDDDGSEAYCKQEIGEFEIDLEKLSTVNEIRIQWWGWSKAAEYDVYAKNEFEDGSTYVKFLDQSQERVDGSFNHWSYIEQIESMGMTKLKFELRKGRLDPWRKTTYFGIRHLQIIGTSSEHVVDLTDEMSSDSTAAALIDENPATTWSGKSFKVELARLCFMETFQFNWDKEPVTMSLTIDQGGSLDTIALAYSVCDSTSGLVYGTTPFNEVSIQDFTSSIEVNLSDEDAVLKGIAGQGTCYGAKDILKQKVDLFYQDHTLVKIIIGGIINEFDYMD